MRKLKIKPLQHSWITLYKKKSQFVEPQGLPSQHYFAFSKSGSVVKVSGNNEPSEKLDSTFEVWRDYLNSVEIDLQKDFSPSIEILETCKNLDFEYLRGILSEFIDAIKDYKDHSQDAISSPHISNESAKQFLYLVPIFASHKSRIYVDSNNGCLNVDLPTRDNGMLSAHILGNGHIHYSYVARNSRIYKITGTAKFKDSKDFIKFNKVLQML